MLAFSIIAIKVELLELLKLKTRKEKCYYKFHNYLIAHNTFSLMIVLFFKTIITLNVDNKYKIHLHFGSVKKMYLRV